MACVLVSGTCFASPSPKPIASIIESRCIDCHDSAERKGGVDLEKALFGKVKTAAKAEQLWIKVEAAIRSGEMPPKKKKPLTAAEKKRFAAWFEGAFVLKGGKEHVGRTVLRRLTRYELINTLEDLLHISLRRPYVFNPALSAFGPSDIQAILPPDVMGDSGFHNDAISLADLKPPVLAYNRAFDYALRAFSQNEEARKKIFGFEGDPGTLSDAAAQKNLQRFMTRAYRGYKNPQNERVVFKSYQARRKAAPPVASLLHAMKTALLSPAFVYRFEDVKNRPTPYRVGAYALANRLSYFLWASMPDEALMRTAADGSLLKESVLLAQTKRMLSSPRRIALAENFGGQWLGYADLWNQKVFYRGETWTRGVYDELLFFFDELIKSDRPILDVVDSDWVYHSRYSGIKIRGKGHRFPARHADILGWRYKNKGLVEGFYSPPALIKIDKNGRGGGIITSVGIMRLTSAPSKTNPIRRGVWMLDRIIGKPLHAPENVPALSKSAEKDGKRLEDLADIMKAHASKPICASCHKHIDPIGLGLERFGPLGHMRGRYPNKRPVKADGVFPNGGAFKTPKEMKAVLLTEYRPQIVQNAVERMLAYAIGRRIRPFDRPTVERIPAALEKDEYRMNTLITQVVLSKPFQYRQDAP
ncbi:MAG: DUF1592 domain-containing protein [Phycisphaeraceae bacterium]|nr:DUF1592 domain-containing protein [Phycisphaeraceae bacterium]